MKISEILKNNNEVALGNRFWINPEYKFRPISSHEGELHKIRRELPYFGYVDIEIDGVNPFVMFSNNDDLVAQTYFFYGKNSYETLSINVWRELAKESKVIFDIGGFTGLFTLIAARVNKNANIFVFEPIKRIFGRLIINLAVNRLGTKVIAVDKAIGNKNEVCEMNIFQGQLTLSTGSSLVAKDQKKIDHKEYVEVVKLDDFAESKGVEKIDLLKIDVEQAEILALEGMMKIIKNNKPTMLIEVTKLKRLVEIYSMLEEYGYKFAVINDHKEKGYINSFDAFGVEQVRNVLFTTKEEEEICNLFNKIEKKKVDESGSNNQKEKELMENEDREREEGVEKVA